LRRKTCAIANRVPVWRELRRTEDATPKKNNYRKTMESRMPGGVARFHARAKLQAMNNSARLKSGVCFSANTEGKFT